MKHSYVLAKLNFLFNQIDLRKNLQKIEQKKLKQHIEQCKNSETNKSIYKERFYKYIEYGIFLTINTYSEGKQFFYEDCTIQQKAEDIVAHFTNTYIENEKKYINLQSFFPRDNSFNFDNDFNAKEVNSIKQIEESTDVESFIKENKKEIEDTLRKFYISKTKGLRSLIRPTLKGYSKNIIKLMNQAIEDIKKFSNKYKIIYNDDGQVRCFYNVLNLYLHHVAIHGSFSVSKKMRELMFAVSALHPAQDDYIDNTDNIELDLELITKKLNGEYVKANGNCNIESILKLIDVIYKYYQIKKHPLLRDIFIELQRWQLESINQKKECTIQQLLKISFMKGGYAFVLFAYIVLGNMTNSQFEHFFSMGAIFQLLDDFHDVEIDLENNVTTVFTQKINKGEYLDSALNAVISIQKEYEKSIPMIKDAKYPVLLRRIELMGSRYDVFRFFIMNSKYFSAFYNYEFESCFNFYNIKSIKSFYKRENGEEKIDRYQNILSEVYDILSKV